VNSTGRHYKAAARSAAGVAAQMRRAADRYDFAVPPRVRAAGPDVRDGARGAAASGGSCDACDGAHETAACPFFGGRRREGHADAQLGLRGTLSAERAGAKILRHALQVPQPADGSCLFHALATGLGCPAGAGLSLRSEMADWIARNADAVVGPNSLRHWLQHSHGMTPQQYASNLRRPSTWGGGVEMACLAATAGVAVEVYERTNAAEHTMIARFEPNAEGGALAPAGSDERLCVAFTGGNHYELLRPLCAR
jgi:hypothetical protein